MFTIEFKQWNTKAFRAISMSNWESFVLSQLKEANGLSQWELGASIASFIRFSSDHGGKRACRVTKTSWASLSLFSFSSSSLAILRFSSISLSRFFLLSASSSDSSYLSLWTIIPFALSFTLEPEALLTFGLVVTVRIVDGCLGGFDDLLPLVVEEQRAP